jgi:sugar/nucleoside kinase (ribokinase family)
VSESGAREAVTALVVGAISRDVILRKRDAPELPARPGGVVHYAGLALARLGARTRAVTRSHLQDAPALLEPLREAGVEVLWLPSRSTTSYANDYSGAVDRHRLLAVSDPIRGEDVPPSWREADCIQLGPLHRADLAPDVGARCRGLRGLDVQGLVRLGTPHGTRLAPHPEMARFLEHTDVVQASETELPALLDGDTLERFTRRFGVREMIVTRGVRGATLLAGGHEKHVAALAVRGGFKVGAGDVFLAAYLFLRARGREPFEAGQRAALICSARIQSGEIPDNVSLEEL